MLLRDIFFFHSMSIIIYIYNTSKIEKKMSKINNKITEQIKSSWQRKTWIKDSVLYHYDPLIGFTARSVFYLI